MTDIPSRRAVVAWLAGVPAYAATQASTDPAPLPGQRRGNPIVLPGDPPFNVQARSYRGKDGVPVRVGDDTAGMVAFFRHCIDTGTEGYIPAGIYVIDWGALNFDNGHRERAWPVIRTAGSGNVLFVGRGNADAPMIAITNGVAPVSDNAVWTGGELGGITVYNVEDKAGASNRHALLLQGIQQTRFAGIVSFSNQGHTVFTPHRYVLVGSLRNPDPYHVYACTFGFIFGLFNAGYAVRNENGLAWAQCDLGDVRAVENGGGIYGFGGGNSVRSLSAGAVKGWALHSGTDRDQVTAFFFRLGTAEIDDCRYGIFMGRARNCTIDRTRIIGRYDHAPHDHLRLIREGFWPKVGVLYGGGGSGDAYGNTLDLIWRIDGPLPAGIATGDVPVFIQGSNVDSEVENDRIALDIIDNSTQLPALASRAFANFHVRDRLLISHRGKPILDTLARIDARASCTRDLTVKSGVWGTEAAIPRFDSARWDRGGDLALDSKRNCHGFVAPATGWVEAVIELPLLVPAGTLVRIGLMTAATVGGAVKPAGAVVRSVQIDGKIAQTHVFRKQLRVTRGDVLYPAVDQNSGRDGSVVADISNEGDIVWQVRAI